jgi:hypothetical protein
VRCPAQGPFVVSAREGLARAVHAPRIARLPSTSCLSPVTCQSETRCMLWMMHEMMHDAECVEKPATTAEELLVIVH